MLEAKGLSFSYRPDKPVLRSVSLEVQPGECLAILGANGCGKSTLMSLLTAARRPLSGRILLDGVDMREVDRRTRALKMAFVSQHSHANRVSVFDAVLMGRQPHLDGAPSSQDLRAVEEVLQELGLEELALANLDELSGGEYQTVMLARAFAQDTPYLLLDEPTNNLDLAHQQRVLRLVRKRAEEHGVGVAAVLHDVNLALRYCDAFAFIKDGIVDARGGIHVVTEEEIARVYGLEVDIISTHGTRVMVPR